MEEEIKDKNVMKKEINASIDDHLSRIKEISDSITSLMGKEEFIEADLDKAFELNDSIQQEYDAITGLLFDLRDVLFV